MAHPTAIWIRGARSTKNVAAPTIVRCTRSRCSRTTACTRCRTWRGRPTGTRGRRTALGRWRRSSRRGSPSIPTVRGSSRRSIGSASATRGSATSSRRAPRSTSTAWSHRPATRRASPRSFAPTSARVTSRPRCAGAISFRIAPITSGPRRRGRRWRIANAVQRILATGKYTGAVWTQGSPRIEEAMYWLNLLVDTTLPICGNAAQRPHGQVSNDGDKNIVDSVEYIVSRVWADEAGRNRAGVVLVQDQQVFAARDVQKADARPGGYVTTGGHGGVPGAAGGRERTPLKTNHPFNSYSLFFFNDTATTEIYTLSLHDALPIYRRLGRVHRLARVGRRGRAQPRGRRARAGPAGVRGAGRPEGRRASGWLRHHRRSRRDPRRGGLGRPGPPHLRARDTAHVSLRRQHHTASRRRRRSSEERRATGAHQGPARRPARVGDSQGHHREGRQLHDRR